MISSVLVSRAVMLKLPPSPTIPNQPPTALCMLSILMYFIILIIHCLFFETLYETVNGQMSKKKLFNTIILINHCIPGLGPSQFTPKLATYSTWDRLPSSTCWSALSSPCTSLHSSLHARGCFYHIFLHWACRCPKVPACGCLLSHRSSDLRGSVSLRSVLMHGVEAPPANFIVWARNIHMSVHVHHIILHWACRCPKQRPCMWFYAVPLSVWFCGDRLPKVCSDAWGRIFPLLLSCWIR